MTRPTDLSGGEVALLRAMLDAAIAAALPDRIVPAHLPPPPKGRTIVLGAGKASAAMAKAVEDHWPGPLEGLVVTRFAEKLDHPSRAGPDVDQATDRRFCQGSGHCGFDFAVEFQQLASLRKRRTLVGHAFLQHGQQVHGLNALAVAPGQAQQLGDAARNAVDVADDVASLLGAILTRRFQRQLGRGADRGVRGGRIERLARSLDRGFGLGQETHVAERRICEAREDVGLDQRRGLRSAEVLEILRQHGIHRRRHLSLCPPPDCGISCPGG